MMKGIVFKIQKYSIHDGPGIRTMVFLKGCPLNCWWCHNPEGQELSEGIAYRKDKCLGCGRCAGTCPDSALHFSGEMPVIDKKRCTNCCRCVDACPSNALEALGREMTVAEIMGTVEKDLVFYDESGGGVTFTGGEPFFQYEFLYEVLKSCRRKGIHTVVETSGQTAWEMLEGASAYVDLFFYDLKLMDEVRHKKYTGVHNQTILSNLEKLSRIHSDICVRIPVIPGINDDSDNMEKTRAFLLSTSIRNVEVLPYHSIGIHKYDWLGMAYKLNGTAAPDMKRMEEIAGIFEDQGFRVKIGG